jgi:predicted nucleic acid-binding Zn ribbon protein
MERAVSLIGKLQLPRNVADAETRARAAWAAAVGKRIVRYTRATLLVRDKLVIEVEDIVWQRQLTTMRPLLIHNVNKALGEALVAEIEFRPMQPRFKPQPAASARPQTAAPDEADGIADPVMRMLYKRSAQR